MKKAKCYYWNFYAIKLFWTTGVHVDEQNRIESVQGNIELVS